MYRSLLHLSWVDQLVDNIKTLFLKLYGEQLKVPHTTIIRCSNFDEYYDQQIQAFDKSGGRGVESQETSETPALQRVVAKLSSSFIEIEEPSDFPTSPNSSLPNSRPGTPMGGHILTAKNRLSRRQRKKLNSANHSGTEVSPRQKKAGKSGKKGRKWDVDGVAGEEDDSDVQLDYSAPAPEAGSTVARSSALHEVDASTWGTRTKKGQFVLRDLDAEVESMLASTKESGKPTEGKPGLLGSGVGFITDRLKKVLGGKVLTKEDLQSAMAGMEEHLIKKNVAREAAVRLCDGIREELIGVRTGNFESRQMADLFPYLNTR